MRDFFGELRARVHAAHEQAFRKFAPYAQATFLLDTGSVWDAQDLNQELWLRVYEHADQFEGTTFQDFFMWLKANMHSVILETGARRQWAAPELQELPPTCSHGHGEPHASAARRMLAGMSMLGGADRDVLIMFFYQRLSHGEASALLGITTPEFFQRLYRALVRFRVALSDMGPALGKIDSTRLGSALADAIQTMMAAA